MTAFESYSDKRLLILILPLVLLGAIIAAIGSLPNAHAAGYPGGPGLVCLTDTSAAPASPANPCPSTPYTFDGPYPSTPQISPTQIRVGVYVNGSAGLNGFDITLLTNHSVLSPVGFDLTGTVLSGTAVIVNECLSGVLVSGSSCFSSDTIDTLHLAATSQLGSPVSPSPTTGLLFTAIYNVVALAPTGGISVGFQTGCSNTGVPGGVCVTITNGTVVPNAETVQTGTSFNNSGNTVPWIAETSNSSIINVVRGASNGNSVSITTNPENGWPGFSTDSISLTSMATSGFTAPSLSASTCSPAACTIIATANTATAGNYSATIYGSYVAFDTNGLTVTLTAPVTVHIIVQDVAWTINSIASSSPQTDYLGTTAPMHLVFTAQSLGGYSGTITYSTSLLNDSGTGIKFAYPVSFTVSSGATVTKLVNATATTEGVALYQSALNATGLLVKNSVTIAIKVSGFALATNTTSLTFNAGKSAGVSVTATSLGNPPSLNGFAGSISISKSISGPGTLTVNCNSSLILTSGGSVSGTCSFSGSTAGTYTVTIKGTGGTNNDMTNSTTVTLTILSVAGFSVSASPASVTVNAGTAGISTITVSSSGSFNQAVSFTEVVYPSLLTCALTLGSITPPAEGTATAILSCSGPAGLYSVTLTGASAGFPSKTVTVKYTVQDFSLIASSTSSVDATQSTTSTITITSLDGFNGTVTLTVNPSAGLTASLSSTLVVGGSGTVTLILTSPTAGNYTFTVTGTSGQLSHTTVPIHVQVLDFQLLASPTIVNTTLGASVTSLVTVMPLNGFTDTVRIATTVSPSMGLTCSANPSSITGGLGNATLTCSGIGGTYTVIITGTNGSLSHSTMITINVMDFTMTASPASITLVQGTSGTSSITVTSVGAFTGTVSLTPSVPTGLTASFSPTSIIMSGTSTLTIGSVFPTTATGIYIVSFTGTSAGLAHSVTISVNVTSATANVPPPFFTQSTWNHRFSLSKYNGIQTFKFGVKSNSTNTTIYLSVTITGVNNNGGSSFTLISGIIALAPNKNTSSLTLSQSFSPSQIGETFSFEMTIHWGTTPTSDTSTLAFTSTATNGAPTSGSFTVLS